MRAAGTTFARAAWSRVHAYAELGKLRLSALAVLAVVAGLHLGRYDRPSFELVLACTLSTLLVAIGGNALNMFVEREQDRAMSRTSARPLPTGRLQPGEVLAFGVVMAAAGLAVLLATTNLLATALCAAIFVTYVLVYTPLKRITVLNTLVGAIPGALPPVVGYAASSGRLDLHALVLFLILFFWQIPHFLSIAWRYREDYARGGMKMLPVADPAGASTSLQMVVYASALVIVSLFAYLAGVAGPLYLIVAVFLGLLFTISVGVAAVFRLESTMRLCFLTSIIYLPLLLLVMVLDKA